MSPNPAGDEPPPPLRRRKEFPPGRRLSTVRVVRSAERGGRPGLSVALVAGFVVIAAIGYRLSAYFTVTTATEDVSKSHVAETRHTLSETAQAVELFRLNHGRFPDRLEDLVRRPADVSDIEWPPGGYVRGLPMDGWGRPFHYRKLGPDGASYELSSLGSDGKPGGAGSAEDIGIR